MTTTETTTTTTPPRVSLRLTTRLRDATINAYRSYLESSFDVNIECNHFKVIKDESGCLAAISKDYPEVILPIKDGVAPASHKYPIFNSYLSDFYLDTMCKLGMIIELTNVPFWVRNSIVQASQVMLVFQQELLTPDARIALSCASPAVTTVGLQISFIKTAFYHRVAAKYPTLSYESTPVLRLPTALVANNQELFNITEMHAVVNKASEVYMEYFRILDLYKTLYINNVRTEVNNASILLSSVNTTGQLYTACPELYQFLPEVLRNPAITTLS